MIFTQLSNRAIDGVVVIDIGSWRPKLVLDLLPGHQLAGVLQQQNEDLQRLLLQLDARSMLTQFSRPVSSSKPPNRYTAGRVSWPRILNRSLTRVSRWP